MDTLSDSFRIRLISEDDAPQLSRLIDKNKIRLCDYFPNSIKSIVSEESAMSYIREKVRQCTNKVGYCFVIELPETAGLIGIVFLKNVEWTIPKAELAYFIDGEHEGKGIVTGSIRHVIAYAFVGLKLNKLYLRAAGENKGSQRVAEKNGFRAEGTLRSDFKTSDGKLIDLIYYGLLR
jgi:ribosomal-protein-serine acetyltransferase